MYDQAVHQERKYFCHNCLQVFSAKKKKKNLKCHVKKNNLVNK